MFDSEWTKSPAPLRREWERQTQGLTKYITKVFSFWQMKCVRWMGDRHETHAQATTVLMCTCEWIIWISKVVFFSHCVLLLCLPLPLSHSIFMVFSLIKEIFDWIFRLNFNEMAVDPFYWKAKWVQVTDWQVLAQLNAFRIRSEEWTKIAFNTTTSTGHAARHSLLARHPAL